MHDRQRTKKIVKFYDFDLSKVKEQDEPHILFFENSNPVVMTRTNEIIQICPGECIIEINNPTHLSNDQLILMDLFAKGIYYKNLTYYKNLDGFIHALKYFKKDTDKRSKYFAQTLRDAIDGKLEKIEITKTGEFITYSSENISST